MSSLSLKLMKCLWAYFTSFLLVIPQSRNENRKKEMDDFLSQMEAKYGNKSKKGGKKAASKQGMKWQSWLIFLSSVLSLLWDYQRKSAFIDLLWSSIEDIPKTEKSESCSATFQHAAKGHRIQLQDCTSLVKSVYCW